MSPKVSITMATYKGYEYLKNVSLPCIINQSLQDWQLHMIGEGTPDDAQVQQLVNDLNDKRIHYYNIPRPDYSKVCNNPNDSVKGGQFWNIAGVFALNEAVSHCTGEYVAHIDQDDFWKPDHLQSMVAHMDLNKNVNHIYSSVILFFQDRANGVSDQQFDRNFLFNVGNFIYHSSVMYRHAPFKHLRYSTNPSLPGDYRMWREMAKLSTSDFAHISNKSAVYFERCSIDFCKEAIKNIDSF